jgi:hypothetical protein
MRRKEKMESLNGIIGRSRILKMKISKKIRFYLTRLVSYWVRVGIAFSVLLNVITGGPSNQTFSARNYIWKKSGYPNIVWLIDGIFHRDSQHCLNSWLYWKIGKDLRRIHIKITKGDLHPRQDHIYYYHQE